MPPAPAGMSPVLVPEVTVVVHPVDTATHPTYPPGYRWAVQVGGTRPSDVDYCANAGHAATESEALVIGESHGACAAKALRMLGCPVRYAVLRLTHDPIPAVADDRPLTRWDGTPPSVEG